MPNTFQVYWKSNAPANDINCLIVQLEDIGPGPVDQEDDYIEATIDWGTSAKDVNNLKGRLNARCHNCVSKITVDGVTHMKDSAEDAGARS
jgi:hypothetical protein